MRIPRNIRQWAKAINVEIITAKSVDDFHKQGIHKLNPEASDLDDAMYDAEKHGFARVFIHTDATWPSKR